MIMFKLSSCVRGDHVYSNAQNPSVGETVNCEYEGRSAEDHQPIALQEGWPVVLSLATSLVPFHVRVHYF